MAKRAACLSSGVKVWLQMGMNRCTNYSQLKTVTNLYNQRLKKKVSKQCNKTGVVVRLILPPPPQIEGERRKGWRGMVQWRYNDISSCHGNCQHNESPAYASLCIIVYVLEHRTI